jgi:type II secretory pathway component HofQ
MWPDKRSRIIAHIAAGDEVLIKARIGEWYRVHLLPDKRGIIKSGFIYKNVLMDQKDIHLEELGAFAIELKSKKEVGFSGELVSLKFKDADIRDVIICLCSIAQMNVVFDPDVSGKITLSLHDVPWDQALDVILKTNHLGKEIQGNVLRAAKRDTL